MRGSISPDFRVPPPKGLSNRGQRSKVNECISLTTVSSLKYPLPWQRKMFPIKCLIVGYHQGGKNGSWWILVDPGGSAFSPLIWIVSIVQWFLGSKFFWTTLYRKTLRKISYPTYRCDVIKLSNVRKKLFSQTFHQRWCFKHEIRTFRRVKNTFLS